jgi:hypothetical protein
MNNYLDHVNPDAKPAQIRAELSGMSKEDVIEAAVQTVKSSSRATTGAIVGGTTAGVTLGELINLGLKKWGDSTAPGAALVREWLSILRIAPHLVLGLLGAWKYSDLETKTDAALFSASIGLLGPAGARIVDLVSHLGDLSRQQEQQVVAELEMLRTENAALKAAAKGGA